MKLEKITDDYSVVRREFDVEDFLEMSVSRYYRDARRGRPPKTRKLKTRSRLREYEREKRIRLKRIKKGLCSARGCAKPEDGFKMCEPCRTKWRVYNSRCAARKIFPLTDYSVIIDLD
jgi:hypothetical protein